MGHGLLIYLQSYFYTFQYYLIINSAILDARELLRTWREDVTRRSEDVVAIWEEILCDAQGDLSDERWMILEQVAVICTSLRYYLLICSKRSKPLNRNILFLGCRSRHGRIQKRYCHRLCQRIEISF